MTDRPLTTTELHQMFDATDNAALTREERRQRLIDRELFAADLELALTGGCPACGLEAVQMCVCCGSCNCDTHEDCTRPAAEQPAARCGDRLGHRTCTLPAGPHPRGRHVDETADSWWSKSGFDQP